jgi:hypothetical protein
MCTLMRDPVMLPTSKTVMDRDVVKSYLLQSHEDPHTKTPLALADVVPRACLLPLPPALPISCLPPFLFLRPPLSVQPTASRSLF